MTGEGWLPGYIQDYDGQALTLVVPFSDSEFLQTHDVTECSVRVEDGRRISAIQRRKIYALLRDIADWTGYEPQELKELMKYDFLSQCEDGTRYFSLSDADMTTARNFITYLIEFCVVNAVPCKVSLLQQCEDIERYVYACVAHRRCAICGQKAEIHEVERVGMGRDRRKIHHLGQLVEPLCRQHHAEVDQLGQKSFDEKYHLQGIRLDATLCKILKWKR